MNDFISTDLRTHAKNTVTTVYCKYNSIL